MILVAKAAAFFGVLLNFTGSIMLLRDFRDIVQLPFFRWRARHLKGQLDKVIHKRGIPLSSSSLSRAMTRRGVTKTFSFFQMARAPKELRDHMRLNNDDLLP